MDLTDPTTAALLAADALEKAGVRHALYGGLLLAAYGEPRETRDVGIAVVDAGAKQAAAALEALGVAIAPGFEAVVFGGLNTLDLVRPRSERYRPEALDRAIRAPLRDRHISVLAPEDFVLFKLLSTRDLDLEDVRSVLRRSGRHVDRDLIEREVGRLAVEISDHDVQGRWRKTCA